MTELSPETQARNIIDRLKMFNRKERDHLMKFALCKQPEAPEISTSLWQLISNGGNKPNADRMFIGMDYHLNWLYAALAMAKMSDGEMEKQFDNEWYCKAPPKEHKDSRPIQENQQDVDLLIAWFDQRWAIPLRLILVEAKLDSGWIPEQLTSKRQRLDLIRQDASLMGLGFIDWRFLLLSPVSKTVPESGTSNEFYSWSEWNGIESDRRHVKRVSGSFEKWEII